MQDQLELHRRYKPSNGVAWGTFLPWVLGTALLATLFALGMSWLFSRGWYWIIVVPIFVAMILSAFISMAVQKGKCRSPSLAGLFGFLIGVIAYVGYLYFGMVILLGIHNAGRFDLLPKYIALRIRTDVQHSVEHPDEGPRRPNPAINGGLFILEWALVLFFTTRAGYRRANRSFCEKCGEWKRQDLVTFPPGNGRIFRKWFEDDELQKLAAIQTYVPTSRKKQATAVVLERCDWPGGEECPVYFSVKDISSAIGRNIVFDESMGKVRVPRVELTGSEIQALAPLFPGSSANPTAIPGAAPTTLRPDRATQAAQIEVQPISAMEANVVLNKTSIAIGNILGISMLFVFYGSLAGTIACFYFSGLFNHEMSDPVRTAAWLVAAVLCGGMLIFSGYIGLKNSGVLGNRYYRHRARKFFALRRNKLVDADRPGDVPTLFVQVVPRKNWGRLMAETASDTGFLQIDPRRRELRFEGDVERYRIPAAAITRCELANYSSSAGNSLVNYWVVVIQGQTAAGPWEAPISLRQTNWLVPNEDRRRTAEDILGQIVSIIPAAPAAVAENQSLRPPPLPVMPGAGYVAPPMLAAPKPASTFSRSAGIRLIVFIIIIGLSIFRGVFTRWTQLGNGPHAGDFPMSLEAGSSGRRLAMHVTNVRTDQHLIDTAPFYAAGGNWTILDCASVADPKACFTLAIQTPLPATGPLPFQFTKAAILPGQPDAGSRLVNELAECFGRSVPATRPFQPLQTLKLSAAILGTGLDSPEHNFRAFGGSWVATKLFVSNESLDGEIYFNYDLRSGNAQIAESDGDEDADVLTGLAAGLRDGPRPIRSPANDPNFTNDGPRVVDQKDVPNSLHCRAIFARGGKLLILLHNDSTSVATAVSLDNPAQQTILEQFDGTIAHLLCGDPDANSFLLDERTGKSGQLWWINRATDLRMALNGPWGDQPRLSYGDNALSPDGRYAVVQFVSGTIMDQKRDVDVYFVDVQSGASVKADVENGHVERWIQSGNGWRALMVDGNQLEPNMIPTTWLADPATGQTTTVDPATAAQSGPAISPDGRLKLVLHPKTSLDVMDLAAGTTRTFKFNPDDQQFAVDDSFVWLSPRYVRFETPHEAFIDVATMKMGYLPTLKTEDGSEDQWFQYSQDFKWAMMMTKTGWSVGRVVTPQIPAN
jgi:hypothetical protein